MVTCGMIVGFDCDDSVFEAQRQFVHEARIGLAMVNILCAIPQTPLFKRLSVAGRLVDGDAMNRHSTFAVSNVVPLKMSRQTLYDGYLKLMRSLYTVDAFFARIDAVCFGARWLPATGRTRYLRRHRYRWLKLRAWAGVETVPHRAADAVHSGCGVAAAISPTAVECGEASPEHPAAAVLLPGLRDALPLRPADRANGSRCRNGVGGRFRERRADCRNARARPGTGARRHGIAAVSPVKTSPLRPLCPIPTTAGTISTRCG